jgi:hypothetical protein
MTKRKAKNLKANIEETPKAEASSQARHAYHNCKQPTVSTGVQEFRRCVNCDLEAMY